MKPGENDRVKQTGEQRTMNRITTFATALLLLTGSAALADDHKTTVRKERAQRQEKRIDKGVENGSLTKREEVKLEAKEASLRREARQDKRDGGGMTKAEKVKINAKQNKLSREIYKDKHDAQVQKK